MLTSAKLREPWYVKLQVKRALKLHMCVYLCTKFQVSSITVTSFRQEGVAEGEVILPLPPPPTSKRTSKEPTQIRVEMKTERLKVFKATKKKTLTLVF